MSSLLSSATARASAVLTPEFWAAIWPEWKASVLICAFILIFRILYRSFILHFTAHLKQRYHYDFIDDFFKAFNKPASEKLPLVMSTRYFTCTKNRVS